MHAFYIHNKLRPVEISEAQRERERWSQIDDAY